MSFLSIISSTKSRGGVSTPSTPETPPDPSEEDGVNRLRDTAFAEGVDGLDWFDDFLGEVAPVFSAGTVRLQATGPSNRSAIAIQMEVSPSTIYTFSVRVTAVDDASDPARVFLNHVSYALAEEIDLRPTMAAAATGRHYYRLRTGAETTSIKLRLGLDGAGDITLSEPMLDQHDGLRAYVAVGATEIPDEPDPPDDDWDAVPFSGYYTGNPSTPLAHGNFNRHLDTPGHHGHRVVIPRSGTISAWQFQIASNGASEITKSRVGSSTNAAHSFPASWDLRGEIYPLDSSGQINGPALWGGNFTHTNLDGSSDERRQIHELNPDLAVTKGEYLGFFVRNLESSPQSNCPSVNNPCNYGMHPPGSSPPLAAGIYHKDNVTVVRSSTVGGTLSVDSSRGFQPHIALRFSDGVEWGSTMMDSTNSAFLFQVYGSNRLRQRWTPALFSRADQILIGAYVAPGQTPEAGLTVKLSSPEIDDIEWTIAQAQIQRFVIQRNVSGNRYIQQAFEIPETFVQHAGVEHTIELRAPGVTSAAKAFRLNSSRLWSDGKAGTIDIIRAWDWSGLAEYSTNGGSSWSYLGWPAASGGNIPVAFFTNRQMASTLGGLPASP